MIKNPWSEEEGATAKRMWLDGRSKRQIALALGRSFPAVRHFLVRHELVNPTGRKRIVSWTAERHAKLARLWSDPANTATMIGRELSISAGAVKRRAYELGLPSRGPTLLQRAAATRRKAPDKVVMPCREERGIAARCALGGYPVSVVINETTVYAYPVKLGLVA